MEEEVARVWSRGYGLLRLFWHVARGGELREDALLRLTQPKGLFQPHGETSGDRYPPVFGFVREMIGDGPGRRLLSFGCATGEEVFSLRAYFPQAFIKGIDISPRRIKTCRRRLARAPDPRLAFEVAASAEAEAPGSYDAVFAMAVFRHGDLGDGPRRCDHLIRFSDFERAVKNLSRCLRPGGLLAIRHANFRFGDTEAAAGFDPVFESDTAEPQTPLYDRNNCRLDGEDYRQIVFCKRDTHD